MKALLNERAISGVYIVGGTGVVPTSIENELKAMFGDTVKRLGGQTRYETALKVKSEFFDGVEPVIIATGRDYPDALAAGALGLPLILVDGTAKTLDKATLDAIGEAEKVIVVGGSGVVSDEILKQLQERIDEGARRIGGANRYETAAELSKELTGNHKSVFLASGRDFPDALAMAAYAGFNRLR